jgi:hypothetical protein
VGLVVKVGVVVVVLMLQQVVLVEVDKSVQSEVTEGLAVLAAVLAELAVAVAVAVAELGEQALLFTKRKLGQVPTP